MNVLLRLFGITDDPPPTRPCPTCGAPIPIPPANPHIDQYSPAGFRRAYLDAAITVDEYVRLSTLRT